MLELKFGTKTIKTDRPAFVMGIVNATPDSFFQKSRGGYELAMELIEQGADVLDIGGESTRPGFTEVPVQEEIDRIVPLIQKIRGCSNIPISIDTRKAAVFAEAVKAGADVLNDVASMDDDEKMLGEFCKTDAGIILMHRWPENYAQKRDYSNIINVQNSFFEEKINTLLINSIAPERIMIDPGIGFGKSFEETVLLIKNCGSLMDGKYPVLMALSRKRCIGKMTERTVDDRLIGTVAADLFSVENGAKMIRVHDVQAAVDSLNVMKYLKK